jgi:phosphomannomutase
VDLEAIRNSGYKFLIDCMYGAGGWVTAGIFANAGVPYVEMCSEINPAFPGINPQPILPHIEATQRRVVDEKCDAGLIADGDADRIGAVDEHGNVVDTHKSLRPDAGAGILIGDEESGVVGSAGVCRSAMGC